MHGDCYYSIRTLVRHPAMSVAELTRGMGDSPNYSREPSVSTRPSFWSRVHETRGERNYFSGVSNSITWLEGKGEFIKHVLSSGGSVEVIVHLPGDRNIGDSWSAQEMARAAALGVSVGVEVFPNIRGITHEA
jgi:hypothetical protein